MQRKIQQGWPAVLSGVLVMVAAGSACSTASAASDERIDLNAGVLSELVAMTEANANAGGSTGAEGDDGTPGASQATFPAKTWQLPPTVVHGSEAGPGQLKQEERIGSYGQPRWTAHRRFPTTRVYVRPEGEVEAEYWLRLKSDRDGHKKFEHRQELELGLGHRLQLDVYMIENHEDGGDELYFDQSIELRYALADWGELPGNPTFYIEYKFQEDRADVLEMKGLFGGEIAPRWHWGVNLVWEQELADAEETVFELTNGISYSLSDEIAIGLEGKFEIANEKDNRSDWGENLRLGPSFQWSPVPQMHIDVAPLFGLTHDSSLIDMFVVLGWEF
ncbi:MAG: hypothetical protein GC159_21285 [Phycisphaera sp.]|nr:hypothetical protein [Phycisphaera sp.]